MMAATAEYFVVPVMERLIDAFSDYLKDQFKWQTGMKEELERLRENLPMIKAVVSQAMISDRNSALNDWIWQLRDAIDEADDLLDEFEYMKLKEQVTTQNMEETKKRSATTRFLFETARKLRKVGHVLRIDPNLKKLQEVVQKLDKVSAEVRNFRHLVENAKQEQQKQELELYKTRETGSLPKNDFIGRGKDMEFVMQWLRKPSTQVLAHTTLYNNISLLSIVGHGGMGKTTLLQHVYEEIKEEFDLKIWVCVFNNFETKKVMEDMLDSLGKKEPAEKSLDALQKSVKSEVMSKKFLLVLDDIWEKEEERDKNKWSNVLAPLAFGSPGSKILVSTRIDSTASLMAKVIGKRKETLKLEGLKDDECLQLLNTHAFAHVDNVDDHEQLRSIARQNVKKLSASPLAAKVIGGVLSSDLSVRHWKNVLNSDIGSTEHGQNDFIPILRLSYTFLPKYLQNCFIFCSIFQQDHKFDRDDLVRMWISLGFIQPPISGDQTMEDIGDKYFDMLVRKSFFEYFDEKRYYKMHDLLHDLAKYVSEQECFKFEEDEKLTYGIPKTIRHLSVATSNLEVLRQIRELKLQNLHSLFLDYHGEDKGEISDVIDEIFKASRNIRCLVIRLFSLRKILEAIENLIHLRYLNLSDETGNRLSGSLSSLYHLQFIIIESYNFCDYVSPRDINNLSRLHYMEGPEKAFSMIPGIGKLILLQSLDGFYVKNENGYRIGELEQMNDLRKLDIKFLENVGNAEEACSAKLCKKRNLRYLHLDWVDTEDPFSMNSLLNRSSENGTLRNNSADPVLDAKVLENLQPPNNLEDLFISEYMGAKSAKWMENPNLISNLKCIHLNKCWAWKTLPPFEQLPYLKSLFLINMPKVQRLCNNCVFPSLKELVIVKLEALEHWYDAAKAIEDVSSFPCLTSLVLEDCPNLQELPSLPPKLVTLKTDNIGWKALNNIPTSLKSLILRKIPLLKSLSDLPSSLCHLQFEELDQLDCLPSLHSLSSLPTLSISKLPKLRELIDLPPSLHDLILAELDQLHCLPSSLPSHSSLRNLTISEVPKLRELSDLPSSLDWLSLYKLDELVCLPSSLRSLSSLSSLSISNATKLRELPDLPRSLSNLDLKELDQLDCLPSSLPSLSSLRISEAPKLQELLNLPPSLSNLSLYKLDELDCLSFSLPSHSSLRELRISKVPKLRELPDLPSSLDRLCLEDLDQLDCLPSSLPGLSSLHELYIKNAPKLRELPNLPPSLESLRIDNCHPELKGRYNESSAPDWSKIAHIPHVSIK